MSKPRPLVIVGVGGFGRETLELLRIIDPYSLLWNFIGFVDPIAPDPDLLSRLRAPYIGDDDKSIRLHPEARFIVAIGDPHQRRTIVARYVGAGLISASLKHPNASIGSDVTIGEGSIICSQASITTNIKIGQHVHVDRVSTIGHDSQIGNYVSLHPGSVISGSVSIGSGTRVGSNACVLPGISIGDNVIVGAGAVVTKDVEPGLTVVGVPAHPVQ